jgi:hypothetical protein
MERVIRLRPAGGASVALGRRNRREVPEVKVVEYKDNEFPTPAIRLLRTIKPETQEFRSTGAVHVSDLISKCVRKIALMSKLNMRHPQEQVVDGQGITFAIGDALHDYVKARFIKGHPDKVWARWTCHCGQKEHTGLFAKRPKTTCEHCNAQLTKYNEVRLQDTDSPLVGSPDLLLWLDEYNAFYIIEIKSISAEGWK